MTTTIGTTVPTPVGEQHRILWWFIMTAAAMLLVAPLFAVDVPPLLDYPNHLARLYVLANIRQIPVLAQMFTPNWQIIPNLAVDFLFTPLMHIMPVHTVGRMLLGVILLLNLAGVAAYHRAVFGSVSVWTAASALVGINGVFLSGFLNYQFGQGLAMVAAAVWITLHERRPVTAAWFGAASAVVLFFCHLVGVMLFILLIGSAEASVLWIAIRKPGRWRAMLRAVALVALPAAAALSLYAFSFLSANDTPTTWMTWKAKVVFSLMPFLQNYVFWLDALTGISVVGFLTACVLMRRGRVAPKAVLAIATLAIIYPFAPNNIKGVGFPDVRIPVMLGMLLFAAVRPEGLPRLTGKLAASLFTLLLLARLTLTAFVWHAHAADIKDVRLTIAPVAPGERVAVISVPTDDVPVLHSLDTSEFPTHWRGVARRHLGLLDYDPYIASLLVIERQAFWPRMFVDPSQQPLLMHPEYRLLKDRKLPSYEELVTVWNWSSAPVTKPNPFCGFDHMLLLEGGAIPTPDKLATGWLRLETTTDTAALYRVVGCKKP